MLPMRPRPLRRLRSPTKGRRERQLQLPSPLANTLQPSAARSGRPTRPSRHGLCIWRELRLFPHSHTRNLTHLQQRERTWQMQADAWQVSRAWRSEARGGGTRAPRCTGWVAQHPRHEEPRRRASAAHVRRAVCA